MTNGQRRRVPQGSKRKPAYIASRPVIGKSLNELVKKVSFRLPFLHLQTDSAAKRVKIETIPSNANVAKTRL